jgi:hypothetical protein
MMRAGAPSRVRPTVEEPLFGGWSGAGPGVPLQHWCDNWRSGRICHKGFPLCYSTPRDRRLFAGWPMCKRCWLEVKMHEANDLLGELDAQVAILHEDELLPAEAGCRGGGDESPLRHPQRSGGPRPLGHPEHATGRAGEELARGPRSVPVRV